MPSCGAELARLRVCGGEDEKTAASRASQGRRFVRFVSPAG
jgi:hypothetical protein